MVDKPPLVEHEVIRDTVVTGIGDIQVMGHNVRITLYVDQGPERVIVARLFVTLESIPSGILDIVKATGRGISHALFAEITEAERVGRH